MPVFFAHQCLQLVHNKGSSDIWAKTVSPIELGADQQIVIALGVEKAGSSQSLQLFIDSPTQCGKVCHRVSSSRAGRRRHSNSFFPPAE